MLPQKKTKNKKQKKQQKEKKRKERGEHVIFPNTQLYNFRNNFHNISANNSTVG